MIRSIIPTGFERTSHHVFHAYCPPLPLPEDLSVTISALSSETKIPIAKIDTAEYQGAADTETVPAIVNNTERRDEQDETRQAENAMDAICGICLQIVSSHSTIVTCRHYFCFSCLLSWYKVKVLCPLCKAGGGYVLHGGPLDPTQPTVKLWVVDGSGGNEKPSSKDIQKALATHTAVDKLRSQDLSASVVPAHSLPNVNFVSVASTEADDHRKKHSVKRKKRKRSFS